MSAVPHITEARALAELRGYRAALTRKLTAGDTDAVDRAWDRVTAAEHRLPPAGTGDCHETPGPCLI